MPDPTHEERMSELRALVTDDGPAGMTPAIMARRLREYAAQTTQALAYAEDLAAQLEAERSAHAETAEKHRVVCELVKTVDGTNETLRRQLGEERAKLQAAGRVVEVARELPYRNHQRLRDALKAYDLAVAGEGREG